MTVHGHDFIGHNYMGHDYIGHNCTGHNHIGHNYIGHNYIGHNYIDHDYKGHKYIGHNYIGPSLYDYIGESASEEGKGSRIAMSWTQAEQTLTIAARIGSFDGILKSPLLFKKIPHLGIVSERADERFATDVFGSDLWDPTFTTESPPA